ncbi:hypothetical protein K461DRAFT_295015 [Myriangium duriaei CBS 260.36]|uniref:Apple domain-containing protein n=1 Tax=Myriangium duriaei CBS 260.36 TaxID=1168546 RepID=A0A9P4J081_9PEZI|nr:hypothetical protein K461DRAFT_295015 [Myriangium duriaei CBS 260.36]
MAKTLSFSLFLFLSLTIPTSATSQGARHSKACALATADVSRLRKDIAHVVEFCDYFTAGSGHRLHSPFNDLEPAAISQACACIPWASSIRTATALPTGQKGACNPADEVFKAFEAEVRSPMAWCDYWLLHGSQHRVQSPFNELNARQLSSICHCAVATKTIFSKHAHTSATEVLSTTPHPRHKTSSTTAQSKKKASSTATQHRSLLSHVRSTSTLGNPTATKRSSTIITTPVHAPTAAAPGSNPSKQSVLQAGTATTAEPFVASATTRTLTQVVPTKLIDVKNIRNLDLANNTVIYFHDPSDPEHFLAVTPKLDGPATNLDYSSYVQGVECTPSGINITFYNATQRDYALSAWANASSNHFYLLTTCNSSTGFSTSHVTKGAKNARSPNVGKFAVLQAKPINAAGLGAAISGKFLESPTVPIPGDISPQSNLMDDCEIDIVEGAFNLNSSTGPDYDMTDVTPWGLGSSIYGYSGPIEGTYPEYIASLANAIASDLIHPLPAPNSVEVNCVQCSLDMDLRVTGKLQMFSNAPPQVDLALNGSINAVINLGTSVLWPMGIDFSQPLFEIPLTTYQLDGRLIIHPALTVRIAAAAWNIPDKSLGQIYLGNEFGVMLSNFGISSGSGDDNSTNTVVNLGQPYIRTNWSAVGDLQWYNASLSDQQPVWSISLAITFKVSTPSGKSSTAGLAQTISMEPVPERNNTAGACSEGTLQGSVANTLSRIYDSGEVSTVISNLTQLPDTCFGNASGPAFSSTQGTTTTKFMNTTGFTTASTTSFSNRDSRTNEPVISTEVIMAITSTTMTDSTGPTAAPSTMTVHTATSATHTTWTTHATTPTTLQASSPSQTLPCETGEYLLASDGTIYNQYSTTADYSVTGGTNKVLTSMQDCIDYCDELGPSCVAVVWVLSGQNETWCYPKGSLAANPPMPSNLVAYSAVKSTGLQVCPNSGTNMAIIVSRI